MSPVPHGSDSERRPRLMGVVNATPDSFSDGGLHASPEAGLRRGLELLAEGADLLDIGGESTRPGAAQVPVDVEIERVVPIVRALARETTLPLSIDTRKAEVAAAALDAGATWVNDVSAGTFDPGMLPLVARAGCTYVCMHARGQPENMQDDPRYGDPVAEVRDELAERIDACLKSGIQRSRIVVDPGIGFGKRLEDNLELLRRLPELRCFGLPLLVGVSRKSFLGTLTSVRVPAERLAGSAAAVTVSVLGGADVLRVHDVAFMAQVVQVAAALTVPAKRLLSGPGPADLRRTDSPSADPATRLP